MLVTVLNCYQPEEVKWKDLSRQIIDLLLPLLANKQVKSFYCEILLHRHQPCCKFGDFMKPENLSLPIFLLSFFIAIFGIRVNFDWFQTATYLRRRSSK